MAESTSAGAKPLKEAHPEQLLLRSLIVVNHSTKNYRYRV